MIAFQHASTPALQPELQALIDRGMLTRAQADEVTAFAVEVQEAVCRGEMTLRQAETMGQMLGVRYGQARRRTLTREDS